MLSWKQGKYSFYKGAQGKASKEAEFHQRPEGAKGIWLPGGRVSRRGSSEGKGPVMKVDVRIARKVLAQLKGKGAQSSGG